MLPDRNIVGATREARANSLAEQSSPPPNVMGGGRTNTTTTTRRGDGTTCGTTVSSAAAGPPHASSDNPPTITNDNSPTSAELTISYSAERIIGNGSFGVVFQASVVETGEIVAIKKVLQDKRFKNRELQIMRQLVKDGHSNIVALKHCFYSQVSWMFFS
jgi:hypothetical protein